MSREPGGSVASRAAQAEASRAAIIAAADARAREMAEASRAAVMRIRDREVSRMAKGVRLGW